MIGNLAELVEKITQLTNSFVEMAVAKARDGQKPVYVSLFEAAPAGFPIRLMEHLTSVIQGELQVRPEIKSLHMLSLQDVATAKLPGRLIFSVECEPEYLNIKEPTLHLSMARMAEIGQKGIEYVYEESEDIIQDLTERLGMSIDEVSCLDPSYSYLSGPANSSHPASELLGNKIQNAYLRCGNSCTVPSQSELIFD